jgi:translation elongation factor P/translation initiation factor 5A
MIDVNELRKGVTFEQDGSLYKVLDYAHNKPGRGAATIRIKARDLRKGTTLEMTFNSGNRVQDVRLEYHNSQFLYSDDRFYYFMDNQNYEQYPVNAEIVGDQAPFLNPTWMSNSCSLNLKHWMLNYQHLWICSSPKLNPLYAGIQPPVSQKRSSPKPGSRSRCHLLSTRVIPFGWTHATATMLPGYENFTLQNQPMNITGSPPGDPVLSEVYESTCNWKRVPIFLR